MFETRLNKLRKSLLEKKVDALIVSSSINIQYLTGYSNFSREEREAYLFATQSKTMLFTDGRYIEAVERTIHPSIKATIKSTIKTINQIIKHHKIKKIGFERNLTFAEYEKFKKEIEAKFILTNNLVENLRQIKNNSEILAIKKAAKLTGDTFKHIVPLIKLGITEQQIAFEIETYIKRCGGMLAFDTIVAFGVNSSVPHHLTSNKKLSNKDQFVLLDFGAKVDGYCSDMTRTLLTKSASNKARKIYQTVLEAQQQCFNVLIHYNKPYQASKIAKIANDFILSKGSDPVPHGLGHGIGLEVHESPRLSPKSKDKLVKGNVFTIEPGIYIPGFGGVRIEDDFLLSNKPEQLTKSPKGLEILA